MRRTRLPAALLLAAVVLAGCGSDPEPAAAPSPPPAASSAAATTRPAAIDVECTNIDRAHNVWDGPRLAKTASDISAMNDFDIKFAMEAGGKYLDAVSGYNDQPSKVLASAIAEYNVELSMINVELTLSGKVDAEQVTKTATAAAGVFSSYQSWRTTTCG